MEKKTIISVILSLIGLIILYILGHSILVVILSLIALITLHELGHFILARFFKVKVEEFGIFLPPRIWGKQIGETIYSINALPLGAFVKLYGEDDQTKDSRSFASKPIWQRALIVAGGVISFWLIAVIIFTYVLTTGSIQPVLDDDDVVGARVQVSGVSADSPASQAKILPGDFIKNLKLASDPANVLEIDKVGQVQEFTINHKGQPIVIEIQRVNEIMVLDLTPRENPPNGEGAVGVSLVRTAEVSFGFSRAVVKSVVMTRDIANSFFAGWGMIIGRVSSGKGLPPGAQFVGPIGIGVLMNQAAQMGVNYYLQFVAIISVYLAIFNALPIPALDGGKLVFLGIEAVRRRPVSEKVEQSITAVFFFILIALSLLATIGDISRLL